MIPEFCGYFCRIVHAIEGRSYCLIVVIRTSGANRTQKWIMAMPAEALAEELARDGVA